MAELFIRPRGIGNGSSWASAAAFTTYVISEFMAANPGGTVYISAFDGPYEGLVGLPMFIKAPGPAPSLIAGVNEDLSPGVAILRGSRFPWVLPADPEQVTVVTGQPIGPTVFRTTKPIVNLTIRGLRFENMGSVFYAESPWSDVTIEDCPSFNIRAFFTMSVAGLLTDCIFSRNDVTGFSKPCFEIRRNSSNLLFEDMTLDSGRQAGDAFAVGIALYDTVHDVMHRNVTVQNCDDRKGTYWNGDGFSAEDNTYNLTWENCTASGCTDGGWDVKPRNGVVLRDCTAIDNKYNFRFWRGGHLIDCKIRYPWNRTTPGPGMNMQLAMAGADVILEGGHMIGNGIEVVGTNTIIRDRGCLIMPGAVVPLAKGRVIAEI